MQRSSGPRIVADGLCPEIVMQADIGGVTIAFTELVSGKTAEEIDARLDAYVKAINRQRSQVSLTEAMVNLQACANVLKELPESERAYKKARIDERVRLVASFEATHIAAGKRAEFQLQPKHKQALEAFDAATKAGLDEQFGEKAKLKLEQGIAQFKTQVDHNKAIIGGLSRSEFMEAEAAAKAAAD